MGSAQRDRLLHGVRVARWATGLGAAGLTAAFSVAAAHAFKGHDGHAAAKTASPARRSAHVAVPGPEAVPSISSDGSLAAPQQAPQAVAPQQDQQQQQAPQEQAPQQQQAPAPPVSGGS